MLNLFQLKIQLGETLSTQQQHLLINGKWFIHFAQLNKNYHSSFKDFLLSFFHCIYITQSWVNWTQTSASPQKWFSFVSPISECRVQQATANVLAPQSSGMQAPTSLHCLLADDVCWDSSNPFSFMCLRQREKDKGQKG